MFVKDTATTEIYTYGHTLSLHDALPIYRFGRCAGIAGADRDRWRNDGGELRHRQPEIGEGADDRDDDRDHAREDRAADKEMTETHVESPRPTGAGKISGSEREEARKSGV